MVADKGVAVVVDDMGEGMQCSDHPYRSNPGGICAFCLQEKLGKLVSSSNSNNPFFPIPPPTSSSRSSSSPSFRFSDLASSSSLAASASSYHPNGVRPKIPYILFASNHKKKTTTTSFSSSVGSSSTLVLKRSKSVAPARPFAEGGGSGIMDVAADSPRKKSFWSFLHLSSSSSSASSSSSSAATNNRRLSSSSSAAETRDLRQHHQPQQQQRLNNSNGGPNNSSSLVDGKISSNSTSARREHPQLACDESDSPNGSQASSFFGRKVARSRSVGCGSRSFSGDFLERISTGFGDCTLRRVESQREVKPRILHRVAGDDDVDGQRIKERVKCGGIFTGFGMISASSYWLSAASADQDYGSDGHLSRVGNPHGRSRSWTWAFASPMRALRTTASASKPYSCDGHGYNKDEAAAKAAANVIASMNSSTVIADGGGDAPASSVQSARG